MKVTLKSLHRILDKIQVASLHATGVSELKKLVDQLNNELLIVEEDSNRITITNKKDLQIIVNNYDSSIQIDELL
jgi:hypothetical protein